MSGVNWLTGIGETYYNFNRFKRDAKHGFIKPVALRLIKRMEWRDNLYLLLPQEGQNFLVGKMEVRDLYVKTEMEWIEFFSRFNVIATFIGLNRVALSAGVYSFTQAVEVREPLSIILQKIWDMDIGIRRVFLGGPIEVFNPPIYAAHMKFLRGVRRLAPSFEYAFMKAKNNNKTLSGPYYYPATAIRPQGGINRGRIIKLDSFEKKPKGKIKILYR